MQDKTVVIAKLSAKTAAPNDGRRFRYGIDTTNKSRYSHPHDLPKQIARSPQGPMNGGEKQSDGIKRIFSPDNPIALIPA